MSSLKNMEKTSVSKETKYLGRIGQFLVYLKKQFRLFILQSDWKVLPMSAIIATLVSMAVGKWLFVTMEGTFQGTFALTCVCIWNGFFNSIQSICRERAIIKREHRAGMHITSYVLSHIVYQLILCLSQTLITIVVLYNTGVKHPKFGPEGMDFTIYLFISLFLITFAADMMALMISAIVHSQMSAMTVMPFMLIIQLVFSGFIALPNAISDISKLMLSKWGVQSLCSISDYNNLPAVMIWNKMYSGGDNISIMDGLTLKNVMDVVIDNGMQETVLENLSKTQARDDFAFSIANVAESWGYLILFTVVFAVITVAVLEYIDKDKR